MLTYDLYTLLYWRK